MLMTGAHFILVEAERYRWLAYRARDPELAAQWRRVAEQYEDLVRRHDERGRAATGER